MFYSLRFKEISIYKGGAKGNNHSIGKVLTNIIDDGRLYNKIGFTENPLGVH